MKRIVTIMIILALVAGLSNISFAQRKSPAGAALMSAVLPGAGQFYTHQSAKGWLMAGAYISTMSLVVAYGPWTWEEKKTSGGEFFNDLSEGTGTSGTTKAIWYGSAALAGTVWLWSVIDAPKAAKRLNGGKAFITPYYQDGVCGLRLILKSGL
jgi:TM2 domain-containing membrane protein YozV